MILLILIFIYTAIAALTMTVLSKYFKTLNDPDADLILNTLYSTVWPISVPIILFLNLLRIIYIKIKK